MNKPSIGLQLIIFGRRAREDFDGVVRDAAEAGYEGIEHGNLFHEASPEEIRYLYGKYGLAVAGMHCGYADQLDETVVDDNISFLRQMNASYLICSGVAEGEGLARFEAAAETFSRVGRRCREAEIFFCYHNHDWEFQEHNGVKGIHRLCELTDPEVVKLCVDVYWVTIGGENPAEFIARYANRIPYYHFKDGAPGSFTELGRGAVDLAAAAKAALATNPAWIVCEQDRTDKSPVASIAESREYLRRKLGL